MERKETNRASQSNGLNENNQLVNSKHDDNLWEGNRMQKPMLKPRKSLGEIEHKDITRFRNNTNNNTAQQITRDPTPTGQASWVHHPQNLPV